MTAHLKHLRCQGSVLLPLVEKLSDPDWLNLLIIDVFGESNVPLETAAGDLASPSQHAPCAELEQGPISPPEQAATPHRWTVRLPVVEQRTDPAQPFLRWRRVMCWTLGGGSSPTALLRTTPPPF
ncbi:hypothetical protein FQA47_020342 [Oryzias melastigma]|uniref:PXA domain-containing protein n=1 Tax=Oryzias melastigma TaxID=30732 RepID=A0A834F9N9_ORYME|nr:hypothetical protein FQA47_020342 [Oryzias melastigma]